jgi:hypothetical protein
MRSLLRTGESAAMLAMMFAGALALWIGVPLLWLYIGSRVQEATHSVGAAMGLMLFGAVGTIVLAMPLLGRLNEAYEHVREARGLENYGQVPLEAVLVITATIAVVLFGIWFFFLAGTSPLPASGPG